MWLDSKVLDRLKEAFLIKKNPKFSVIFSNQRGVTLIESLFAVAVTLIMSTGFYDLLSSFNANYVTQERIAEMQQQGRVSTDIFWEEIRNAGQDPSGDLFDPAMGEQTRNKPRVDCELGPFPVEAVLEASPVFFHFVSDLDGNGEIDGPIRAGFGGDLNDPDRNEHIRYEWVGDTGGNVEGEGLDFCGDSRKSFTLYRSSGSGGMQQVATDIVAFELHYFDEDGEELKNPPGTMALSDPLTQAQRRLIRRVSIELTTEMQDPLKRRPEEGEAVSFRRRTFKTEAWLRNM